MPKSPSHLAISPGHPILTSLPDPATIATMNWIEGGSRWLWIILALALSCAASAARADEDMKTEVAKRLFAEGSAAYATGDYSTALVAFQRARLAIRCASGQCIP